MVDKVLFNTSALVAARLKDHPFHKAYFPWFDQAPASLLPRSPVSKQVQDLGNQGSLETGDLSDSFRLKPGI